MLQPIDPGEFSPIHLLKITRGLKTEILFLKVSLGVVVIVLLGVLIFSDNNSTSVPEDENKIKPV